MAWIRCPNWSEFQHYKDRDPPWIKLHRQLLGNYEWSRLPDSAKAHLVGIWLLAARHENKVVSDPEWIANQIGATEDIDLELLLESGMIEEWSADGETTNGKREEWPSRHIPKSVKEIVWERDKGRCCGCAATRRLEYDHVVPVSKGGSADASNIQLLCVRCNRKKRNKLQAAEQVATQVATQKTIPRSLEAEAEAEAEGPKKAPTNWPARLASAFAPIAPVKPGLSGKVLKPAVDLYGADAVERAIGAYCRDCLKQPPEEIRYRGPADFAKRAGYWVDYTRPGGALELLGDPNAG